MAWNDGYPELWQDREIRFDLNLKELSLINGEFEVDTIGEVEDTKGNNGERGALKATNLRLIWIANRSAHINLSIGYNCILNTNIRLANSKLKGNTEALYVLCKFGSTRFEFIFTSLIKQSPRLFISVQSVYRAYETSKLYRDLRLRGAIIKDKELILLPDETILDTVNGVWNLSSEQGNLGTFIITNIRIVWFANLAQNFNVSVPYLQIKILDIKKSKFGKALIIETTQDSGNYVLGFRIDPVNKLTNITKELKSLSSIYTKNPIFGVKFEVKNKNEILKSNKIEEYKVDKVTIIDDNDVDFFRIYYKDDNQINNDSKPVFNDEIGLAVEMQNNHVNMAKLWNIITK